MQNKEAVIYANMTDEELNRAVAIKLGYPIHQAQYSPPGYQADLPQWVSDLNVAATLDFGGHMLQIDCHLRGAVAKVLRSDGGIAVYEVDAKESRARVKAWLVWQDKQLNPHNVQSATKNDGTLGNTGTDGQ